MLKKAGIIGAVAATGVLALSGLAFADTTTEQRGQRVRLRHTTVETEGLFGGSSLLGAVSPLTGILAQRPIAEQRRNCTNIQLKGPGRQRLGNSSATVTKREIEDSFNR